MAARVHPPPAPGRYTLAIYVLREGVDWFDPPLKLEVDCLPVTQRRVLLVNNICLAHDAVGNNAVLKLRLLQKSGFAPLLLTGYIDKRWPLDEQALMIEVDNAQILDPPPDLQWVADHFSQASLYLFDYPVYYPLVELIRIASNGPVIFDYHGVTPPDLWASQVDRSTVELGVENLRLVAYADYAIAHSDYTCQELLATGLIEPERVRVVPYAVPDDFFYPGDQPPQEPPLPAGGGAILLYVGRMAGNKRIDVLIRMVALVKEHYPDVRLLLVGDDTSLPYQQVVDAARQLIVELGLQDNVIFTGPRNHTELPFYYNACDVYVTSSLHEGFCVPVVEAMASGKPVVASAATALPWTIGDAGLLFEPGDLEAFAAHVLELLRSKQVTPEQVYA